MGTLSVSRKTARNAPKGAKDSVMDTHRISNCSCTSSHITCGNRYCEPCQHIEEEWMQHCSEREFERLLREELSRTSEPNKDEGLGFLF